MTLWAVVGACALLLAGFAVRRAIPAMRRLVVPASVIGGLGGLGLAIAAQQVEGAAAAAAGLVDIWRSWPGALIAVVFAGLLLERPGGSGDVPARPRNVALAAMTVWIIVAGEIAIGLGVSHWLARPGPEAPASFGQLLEAGFAGGHGTAAALGQVFASDAIGFPEGRDLGMFMATAGLVWSVLSGVVLVNIGLRCGLARRRSAEGASAGGGDWQSIGRARSSADTLDPLALQAALLGVAVGLGAAMQAGFVALVELLAPEKVAGFAGNVPLFMFALLGGWALRRAMMALRLDHLLDGPTITRLVGLAMEFLIVSALASLRLEAIGTYLGPLLALCAAGFAWAVLCLLVISRLTLPRDRWFELGLINYGMSTGTTAQGMMLLRMVDPELESGAASDYALAAPFSAPFIGGGVITVTLPLLLLNVSAGVVALVAGAAVVALFVGAAALRARSD